MKLKKRMSKTCKNCGEDIQNENVTHCSDRCIFESIKKSKKFGDPENPPDYSV